MAALIVVVGANVVCRYVLGIPLSWAEEAARYMMIYMAYLAAPLALRAGGHIRITVITDRLRGAWADVFRMIGHLAVGSLAVAVAYHGLEPGPAGQFPADAGHAHLHVHTVLFRRRGIGFPRSGGGHVVRRGRRQAGGRAVAGRQRPVLTPGVKGVAP